MAIKILGKVKMDVPFQADEPSGQTTGDLWGKIADSTKKFFRLYRKNGTAYDEWRPMTTGEAVACNDSQTIESKVGAMKGLASSLSGVTDPRYAASAVAVNNELHTISNSITALQTDMSSANTTLGHLQSKDNELNSSISSLNSTINSVTTRLNTTNNNLTSLSNKITYSGIQNVTWYYNNTYHAVELIIKINSSLQLNLKFADDGITYTYTYNGTKTQIWKK